MNITKSIYLALLVCLFASESGFATQISTTWSEDGDAGQSVATAQVVSGSGALETVLGEYDGYQDVDFYLLNLIGGSFSATTHSHADTMVFLWDALGNPLLFNDDYPSCCNSYIVGSFSAGQYILGISTFSNGYGDHHADSGWYTHNNSYVYQYSIAVTGASFTLSVPESSVPESSVPEPGTLALLGLGLVGMAARRRKTV